MILATSEEQRFEEWATFPDCSVRLFDSLKAPFYSPGGEVAGVVGISRDITDRNRAEEELRVAKNAA